MIRRELKLFLEARDEPTLVRALKQLLKNALRQHAVRCKGCTMVTDGKEKP